MTTTSPSLELATAAADLAADRKAVDITFLQLGELSSVADFFVVCTGRSHVQVEAICERVERGVRERIGARPITVEGLSNSRWAILDYGNVVVHVFQEEARGIYDLERLWQHAPHWNYEEGSPEQPARV